MDVSCIAHTSSNGLREAITLKFPALADMHWKDLYNEKKQEYFSLISKGRVELMPGVDALIDILHKNNITSCVVTNSSKEQTDLIKSRSSALQKITHWVTREDYSEPKPHPDSYLCAIKLYGNKGDRLIGFEDSLRGINALLPTPALPILICSKDHPQMEAVLPEGVLHYESFKEMLLEEALS